MSKIELTRKWWNANRPKDLKSPELEKALAGVEEAKGPARLDALACVPAAVAKLSKGLDKKSQKDLLKSLDGLKALAEAETKKAAADARPIAAAKVPGGKAADAKKADAKTKGPEAADQEPETPQDKLFDPAIMTSVIRRALRAPIIFGFAIGAKPELSTFAVNVRGNPKALARIARTRSRSMKACCGQAQADEHNPKTLNLSLDGPPIGGLARALRKYLDLQKISIFKKIRVLVDGQEVEADGGDEGVPAEAAAQAAGASAQTEPAQETDASATAAAPAEEEMEELEDRRREFKRARAAWVAVKIQAEMDLEKVKDGARMAYLADKKQFPKIVKGCKDIDAILDQLDDELRDTLDQYASTPLTSQAKLHQLAAQATEVLDRYHEFVQDNKLMKAIDLKEFADVTVHRPITKALGDLRKALV